MHGGENFFSSVLLEMTWKNIQEKKIRKQLIMKQNK